jgi:quercetin dioxygenase-like cupin family protein
MRPFLLASPVLIVLLASCTARGPHANTSPVRTKAVTLLTERLSAPTGTEGRVLTVDFPPGASSTPHRHDGAIFAYVVDGAVVSALDDGPETRFEAGQAWYERPGQVHRVARNASATKPARLVVFFLTEPGAPVLRPEHSH